MVHQISFFLNVCRGGKTDLEPGVNHNEGTPTLKVIQFFSLEDEWRWLRGHPEALAWPGGGYLGRDQLSSMYSECYLKPTSHSKPE